MTIQYIEEPAALTDRSATTRVIVTCDACGEVSESESTLNPRAMHAIGNVKVYRAREALLVARDLEREHAKVCGRKPD